MKRCLEIVFSVTLVLAAASTALAGSERVSFPESYTTNFTLYAKIDQAEKKKVRFMYVNTAGLADPSRPLPSGSILVMEDHAAALNADGTPKKGSDGQLVPTDKVTNVFVMEKRAGWGEAYPAETRNGDWEYAWFQPDGHPKPGKTMEKCFACHKSQAKNDFMFTIDKLHEKAQAK